VISIKFTPNWKDISIFKSRKEQIIAKLITTEDRLMLELQSHIVRNKLSGNPLHRVTGVLAGSVTTVPAQLTGNVVRAEVQSSAGPAFYGQIHEFGGKHPFDILPTRAKVLRFVSNGEEVFARAVHREPLPARPFMSTALEEMREQIIASIQEAFDRALDS
jgi:phage gpG-like protein